MAGGSRTSRLVSKLPFQGGGRSSDPQPTGSGSTEERQAAENLQVIIQETPFQFDKYFDGEPLALPSGSTVFRLARRNGIDIYTLRIYDYGEDCPGSGLNGEDRKIEEEIFGKISKLIFPYSWHGLYWTGKDSLPGGHRYFWLNWQTNEKTLVSAPPFIPKPIQPSSLGRHEEDCHSEEAPGPYPDGTAKRRWYPTGICKPVMDYNLRPLPSRWCGTEHVHKGTVSKNTRPSATECAHPQSPLLPGCQLVQELANGAQLDETTFMKHKPVDTLRHGFFVFPDAATSFVRRRALLIACTYKDNPDVKVKVENAPTDAKAIYDMLIIKNFKPEDIAILTDHRDHPAWKPLENASVHFEYSNLANISKMMCHLVSGLDSTPANVANSLFFYAAGHGHQYSETDKVEPAKLGDERRRRAVLQWRGEAARKAGDTDAYSKVQKKLDDQVAALRKLEFEVIDECDRKDEAFVTSDFKAHSTEDGATITHTGVLLDDFIKECLVVAVRRLPNTQLVMVMDCCHTGTIADLPFDLLGVGKENEKKNYDDNFWGTSGTMRRLEEMFGPPMPWVCGKGVVYSFAAAKDGGIASENFDSWFSDVPAYQARGALTAAFIKGVVGEPCPDGETVAPASESLKALFLSIQEATEKSNRDFKEYLHTPTTEEPEFMKKGDTPWYGYWEDPEFHRTYKYLYQQEPRLSSSHFCHLVRPLFL